MKFKITCSPRVRNSVARKFVSSSLAVGLLLNTNLPSLAGALSEDGRYETFKGNNITIDNVLEEDAVDVEIEGNTMVNVANQKDEVPITKSYTVEGTNHVPLQGDYDGKARPVIRGNTLVNLYKKGIPVFSQPTVENDFSVIREENYIKVTSDTAFSTQYRYVNFGQLNTSMLKPSTTYTVVFTKLKGITAINFMTGGGEHIISSSAYPVDGKLAYTITTTSNITDKSQILYLTVNNSEIKLDVEVENPMIFEGDIRGSIPDGYVEGLKSSFEDQLVTENMVNSGQEKPENLGKYKVEYKVTGKNKFNENFAKVYDNWEKLSYKVFPIHLKPNTQYTFKRSNDENYSFTWLSWVKQSYSASNNNMVYWIANAAYPDRNSTNFTFKTNSTGIIYLNIQIDDGLERHFNAWGNIQIEEGTTATEYEPYKESIKIFYLNSPLLEGDTLESINGKATHVKRYSQVLIDGSVNVVSYVEPNGASRNTLWAIMNSELLPNRGYSFISDKFKHVGHNDDIEGIGFGSNTDIMIEKSKLISLDSHGINDYFSKNPTNIVYELAEPIYETISEESILIDSYKNGHLDLNSNIPVNKVNFMPTNTNLNYLYPSTEYTVQFESDTIGKVDTLLLGNKVLLQDYSVINGINKFNITTPNAISSTELILDGIGFNLSNLVVTWVSDKDFGYFEGIKSVGQHDLNDYNVEISSNKKLNYTLEPGALDDAGGDMGFPNRIRTSYIDVTPNMLVHTSKKYARCAFYDDNLSLVHQQIDGSIVVPTNASKMRLSFQSDYLNESVIISYKADKKELSLSEPLRSLPSGVKDRIIKKDGKWVVERNCKEIVVNEDNIVNHGTAINGKYRWILHNDSDVKNVDMREIVAISNRYPSATAIGTWGSEGFSEGVSQNSSEQLIYLYLDKYSDGSQNSLAQLKQELKQDPLKVVYQLAEPIYEPLNIDPIVNLYLDTTYISNNSNIPTNMKVVVDRAINRAVEAIELARTNPTMENVSIARMWANLIKESAKKDELQGTIDSFTEIKDLTIEKKTASVNADVYIKMKNSLSLSLDTNSIVFDDFDATEGVEMQNAVNLSVSSSLPYRVNAYLEDELYNADKSKKLDKSILNIKSNKSAEYRGFADIGTPITLLDDQNPDSDIVHGIDIRLDSTDTRKADVYKTTLKFEVIQK